MYLGTFLETQYHPTHNADYISAALLIESLFLILLDTKLPGDSVKVIHHSLTKTIRYISLARVSAKYGYTFDGKAKMYLKHSN